MTIRITRLVVHPGSRIATIDDKRLRLTPKEYDILELLSLRKGTTVTKEMFLNHLYDGKNEPELKIIDVFICKLRKKLSKATGGAQYIETVWGRGYVLRDPEPATWNCGPLSAATPSSPSARSARPAASAAGTAPASGRAGGACRGSPASS